RWRNWVWGEAPPAAIYWNDGGEPEQRYLDLTQESGLRIKVDIAGDTTLLLLQMHHSCCDGLGALKFIEDLLTYYAEEVARAAAGNFASDDEPMPVSDVPSAAAIDRLKRRADFGLGWLGLILRFPLEIIGAIGTLEYFTHKPVPIRSTTGLRPHVSLQPDRCMHQFTAEETKAMKATANEAGATLNDLLVRDLFLAFGDWLAQRDPEKSDKHVRIMVPINLRTRHDGDLSATNVVAMVNVDRRPRRWKNLRRMLRILHWELAIVKRGRFGLTFIRSLQVSHYVFNKLSWLLPQDKCLTTCVLTNLGETWRHSKLAGTDGRLTAGNVTLRHMEVMAPVRPLTNLGIGVFTYAGRLGLTIHYNSQALTAEDAELLLAKFVARLKASAT
ncbi:MAG: hypothetical protein K8T25_11250, partial [Planctomycetia bacterium]|nr:hypothetical protein [Planctomycetia bacterium]